MNLSETEHRYATHWIRRFFASECGALEIPEDLLTLVFNELSRKEESICMLRDHKGNWEWPYCDATRNGTLYVPRVDLAIFEWTRRCGITRCTPSWPDKKQFAICLTHDVDLVSRRATSVRFISELIWRLWRIPHQRFKFIASHLLRHLAKYLAGPALRLRVPDEYHSFDLCMELEAQFGFHSTFFFFAEHLPAPHILDFGYSHEDKVQFYGSQKTVRCMIREMLQLGWDIGLHGSYLSATNLNALKDEKRQLEESAGTVTSSIRHHYLHYDTRRTPSLHEQAGFKVDSTIGFTRNIGFRSGTCFPHYCWDHRENRSTRVLEFPLHVMDGALIGPSGLDCDTSMAVRYVKMLIEGVAKVGGCLTVNWHPSWLRLRPYREIYEAILREAHQGVAWGCSVNELRQHWEGVMRQTDL